MIFFLLFIKLGEKIITVIKNKKPEINEKKIDNSFIDKLKYSVIK